MQFLPTSVIVINVRDALTVPLIHFKHNDSVHLDTSLCIIIFYKIKDFIC